MRKLKVFNFLCILSVFSFVAFFNQTGMAQVEGEDVVIGQSLTMTSKILKREVPVLISVPDGYDAGAAKYPVLYDLGGFYFTYACGTVEFLARGIYIPNMIVVGVPPFQRGYVPTPFEERGEEAAGADLSIKFLWEELIPFVEKNYRTNSFRILHGHSVGGLFTMYTLFNYPDLFTAYVAGSPWFQTNDQYWLKNIEKMAKVRKADDKFLFMTVGKEEAELTLDTFKELEKWMNDNPITGLTWKSAWVEGDHGSMVGRNIYDGLQFIFSGWRMPREVLMNADLDEIQKYIKTRLAKWAKYGFEESDILPEQMINSQGYYFLGREEYKKAVEIFAYNIKRFPKSFNAHDSLGEAYMIMGDKEKAVKYYKLAVELNPGDTEYAKRVLINSKDKLRELGVEK
ncbi:MAG: tetratricopeptide repeat protein [Candidatus Aminicenantes bacterium]|nr:MAG: tetratricopeptide repeat protein [Candidatus Aminicenantes bacterium]